MIERKLLVSLLVVGVAGAAATSGTLAYFSDTEASTGNAFSAGKIDLKIGWDETRNGENVEIVELGERSGPIFSFKDLKPGDQGEATLHLHDYGNDAWVWMKLNASGFDDNGCLEPEAGSPANDQSCGQGGGELQRRVNLTVWYDGSEKDQGSGAESTGDNLYQEESERLIYRGPVSGISEPGNYNYASVIVNDGFEQPVVNRSGGWNIFGDSEINGWNIDWVEQPDDEECSVEEPQLEYQRDVNGWKAHEGEQYVELDSDCDGPGGTLSGEKASVSISQDTMPGRTYQLVYHYSPRPGHPDNKLQVSVNGEVKRTQSLSGTGNQNTEWRREKVVFTAESRETTITFTETGTPDSKGMFLDDVTVSDRVGTFEEGLHLDGNTSTPITDRFVASTDHYLGVKWEFPDEAGNLYQTDSFDLGFEFYAEQWRNNNPNPTNPWS